MKKTKREKITHIIKYTFFKWEVPREFWNLLSLYDKLRAIIFFRVIMPSSELKITDKKYTSNGFGDVFIKLKK